MKRLCSWLTMMALFAALYAGLCTYQESRYITERWVEPDGTVCTRIESKDGLFATSIDENDEYLVVGRFWGLEYEITQTRKDADGNLIPGSRTGIRGRYTNPETGEQGWGRQLPV